MEWQKRKNSITPHIFLLSFFEKKSKSIDFLDFEMLYPFWKIRFMLRSVKYRGFIQTEIELFQYFSKVLAASLALSPHCVFFSASDSLPAEDAENGITISIYVLKILFFRQLRVRILPARLEQHFFLQKDYPVDGSWSLILNPGSREMLLILTYPLSSNSISP